MTYRYIVILIFVSNDIVKQRFKAHLGAGVVILSWMSLNYSIKKSVNTHKTEIILNALEE